MSNKLKPLTENKVTAEIPTEAAAFRGWAIGAHKLVLINIRELADRQDIIHAAIEKLDKRVLKTEENTRPLLSTKRVWRRIERIEQDIAEIGMHIVGGEQ